MSLLRVVTDTRSRGKITKVSFYPTIYVRPSHDRIVNLRFILIKNGKELPQFAECVISAKERKSKSGHSGLELPSEDWLEMLNSDSTSVVKIVMAVKED